MKKDLTIQELEATREQLIKSLNLFDLAASKEAPGFLKLLDLPFAKDLLRGSDLPWGAEGLYPETAQFVAQLSRSESGKRIFLESDIEALKAVKKTGADQIHRGPLGLREAVFPVKIRDAVVHCLWSGKMLDREMDAGDIAEVARLAEIPKGEAADMARTLPVLSKKQVDRTISFMGLLRDSIERAIGQHMQAASLTQQLVQSERAQSLGTLSGGVAHHFNNLLSVILGYSSFVLNREQLSPEASDALRKITEAAQRGRRLTEEILAFLGSEVEEDIPCQLHETITSVLSLLESKTGAAVRVETRLKAARDVVMAQPSSIRQIVFNLLTNAIDSMPAGGVLTVSTTNTQMATESGKQEYVQLEVADSSGALPKIPGGEGATEALAGDRVSMKLSSVYGMVGRLDGTVVVSAEPGTLTRVQVLLPAISGAGEAREEKKIRRRLAPSLIWVVDDDAIFREMCKQVLSDEGHTVEEMSGGREFQERWRRGGVRPDLILMDFSMPEYNGLQLCEWLRAEGSKVPVILVSGFSSTQPDIRKALRLKKTFFLQKPFSFREMADTVTVALGETLIG